MDLGKGQDREEEEGQLRKWGKGRRGRILVEGSERMLKKLKKSQGQENGGEVKKKEVQQSERVKKV